MSAGKEEPYPALCGFPVTINDRGYFAEASIDDGMIEPISDKDLLGMGWCETCVSRRGLAALANTDLE